MTYNRFMQGLKLAGIELDRRVLAELAVNEPAAFAALVETARAAVAAAPAPSRPTPPDPGGTHVPTPSVTGPSGPAPAASAVPMSLPKEREMSELLTERSGRIVAARKLTRRSGRDDAGLFLAEGRQAVAEALADPAAVREVFATEAAAAAHHDLLAARRFRSGWSPTRPRPGCRRPSRRRAWSPSARCATCPPAWSRPRRALSVALAELADPGNAGTVRTADACGAGAVVFGAGSADPFGGKAVRASAGSLFHVDVVRGADLATLLPALGTPA